MSRRLLSIAVAAVAAFTTFLIPDALADASATWRWSEAGWRARTERLSRVLDRPSVADQYCAEVASTPHQDLQGGPMASFEDFPAPEDRGVVDLVVLAHGAWKPARGYVQIPRATEVLFYTHFAKVLPRKVAQQVLSGRWTEVDRTYEEFKMVPDMDLSGVEEAWVLEEEKHFKRGVRKGVWDDEAFMAIYSDEPPTTLSAILDMLEANRDAGTHLEMKLRIHLLCCSFLQLKSTGSNLGVNAFEFPNPKRRPKDKSGTAYRYVKVINKKFAFRRYPGEFRQ